MGFLFGLVFFGSFVIDILLCFLFVLCEYLEILFMIFMFVRYGLEYICKIIGFMLCI